MSHSPRDEAARTKEYSEGWSATYELVRQGRSWSGHERNVCLLNTRDRKFSDVSTVSGLDMADDGRGLAVVDWDRDGAVDLIFSNRTGPQVRAFRNRLEGGEASTHFLALRLEGRQANRDGIGARVEVKMEDDTASRVQTLRAGDGFLSQSSKWLHFGLGDSDRIRQVTVRWPGGEVESFEEARVDGWHRLVQGSGRAEVWQPPTMESALEAGEMTTSRATQRSRVQVSPRLPVYGLKYQDAYQTSEILDIETGKAPILLNLWASWCANCRAELEELNEAHLQLEALDLQVLALSVDTSDTLPAAHQFLDQLDWPFDRGLAPGPLLDVLSALRQTVLDQPTAWVIPISFLIDAEGRLAAIYQGPVTVPQLLEDLKHLDGDALADRERASLFPGRWFGKPAGRSVELLANILRSRGFNEIASKYLTDTEIDASAPAWLRRHKAESLLELGRALNLESKTEDALSVLVEGLTLDPDFVSLHFALATSYEAQENVEKTLHHLQEAVRLEPSQAFAHYRLGLAQLRTNAQGEGIASLEQALALSEPGEEVHYLTLFNLGVHFGEQRRDVQRAEDYVRRSLAEHQEHMEAQRYLGVLLQRRQAFTEAVDAYQRALELAPDDGRTHFFLGFTYYELGNREGVEAQFERLTELGKESARRLARLLEKMPEVDAP